MLTEGFLFFYDFYTDRQFGYSSFASYLLSLKLLNILSAMPCIAVSEYSEAQLMLFL